MNFNRLIWGIRLLQPRQISFLTIDRDTAFVKRAALRYEIEFLPVALAQLRGLPKDARRLLGAKIERLQDGLAGDVKKLKGFRSKYRLRAGNYRVLFELEGGTIVVYDAGDRKEIYE